ncbi:LysM peptidoglycan-binding domain-containing protein [Clostridium sp. ZS2-4]|uniref:LysM peptidoglycan-binding domain-containing protein n=1 Tax=Clostridium sp. ZS2-4 TaxID=2987703 RepID=UPI00227C9276|nr:LysM domain-containing protein [Clostridium sp. ZS2-4]MCY6354603.1 LysM domain-containing protein [Clostridium sp. ZS2-4]
MNSKFKKSLIIISSGIVLFLGVFFMTRSISNLIDTPDKDNVITMDENSGKPATNSTSKEKSNTANIKQDTQASKTKDKSTKTYEKQSEYVVQSGDTLSSIVENLMPWCGENDAIKTIIEMNNIRNSEILPVGVHLLIPENPIDTTGCVEHTILKGETLYQIATKYLPSIDSNKAVDVIMKRNNISDPKSITENRVIFIPQDNVKTTNAEATSTED